MKYVVLFISFFFIVFHTDELCSPARPVVSEMMQDKGNFDFVKGYFLPHDGSDIHLAKFVVMRTSDCFVKGQTYPVFEYGPFGSDCEVYEMGASPLDDEHCGKLNERYLIVYKKIGDGERLVVPIFHSNGLTLDTNKDRVSDPYREYTSLTAFENYLSGESKQAPEWSKLERR